MQESHASPHDMIPNVPRRGSRRLPAGRIERDMSRVQAHSEGRLNWLQEKILVRLGAPSARIEAYGTAEAKATLAAWGVPWKPGINDPRWTPAKRAACARSLRRNRRGPMSRRTTHILLLPRGAAVVQRLTRGSGNSP
jgi:hypothetical protein